MDEHNARRYEAFSDVVIGFCLAQLAFSLHVPAHAADLFHDFQWLYGFAWAFANVCGMWWFHHRLFSLLWIPRPIPVLLNFVWLALIVICIFATQVVSEVGVRADGIDPSAYRFLFASFALAYLLITVQYAVCLRERGASVSRGTVLRGRGQLATMGVWTATFAVCLAMWLPMMPLGKTAPWTWVPFAVAIALSVVIGRSYRRAAALSEVAEP
jgi:uncharacterized membrane protein